LEKVQRIQLIQKLDRLSQVDYDIAKDWIAGTDEPGIFKLKTKSNVQVRTLLCYGPLKPRHELTFLHGVIKKGGGDVPLPALDVAQERRQEVITAEKECRIEFVRNEKKTN
jgi:hypothetical protein